MQLCQSSQQDFRRFMGCRYNRGFLIHDGIFTFVPLLCVVLPGNCHTVGMSLLASRLVFSLSVLPHNVCICLFKIVSLRLILQKSVEDPVFCCSKVVVFAFHSKVGRGVRIACASGLQFYFKANLICQVNCTFFPKVTNSI